MEISTVFYAMVLAALGDALWWLLADARLRGVRHAWLWRSLVALFALSQLGYLFLCLAFPDEVRRSTGPVPMFFQIITYVWQIMVLPLIGFIGSLRMMRNWLRRRKRRATDRVSAVAATDARDVAPATRGLSSRRQVLAVAAAAIPPIVATSVSAGGIVTLDGLRTRKFELRLPNLPRDLDGMTIAQVSDTHIGKFFHADRLPGLAKTVNDLNADFIAFTGDLIDADLDDLPAGLEFLHRLKPRAGMVICEGNHDIIDDRGEFERRFGQEALPLLVGAQMTVPFRGQLVQFLGVPWNNRDPQMYESVQAIVPRINRDAFPILLAHHPHCFDEAAKVGIPLTISGHTHGGQIMLTRSIGAGAVRFRYLSGLYQKANSSLLVSNGIGNWFPIRINAPAELLHITLRSASG